MTKFWQWIRLHPWLSVLLPLCVSIILLNLVAYRQAYAMLNFSPIGKRTDPPESLSFWQKVYQPLILYGRSMGGAAILRAVWANGIQVDAIIIEAVFDKMLSTVQNRFAAMGLPSFPAAQLLIFWSSIPNGYPGFKHNPVAYAQRVQCPTLMLHGTHDPRATLQEGMAVFRSLSGPKRFEVFEDAGHVAYLAAQPEQWRHAVAHFLAQY